MTPSKSIALFERPFYFLRHGQSRLNAQRRIAGSLDTELTALGHDQARAAASILAHQPVSAIYTSPMQRARRTAEYAADALSLPLNVIDEIAERHWGVLEGQPRAMRVAGTMPEDAETFESFVERALSGFARIEANAPLIVAHSGIFRVLCHTLRLVEQEAPVSNALPLRFEPDQEGWRMVAVR